MISYRTDGNTARTMWWQYRPHNVGTLGSSVRQNDDNNIEQSNHKVQSSMFKVQKYYSIMNKYIYLSLAAAALLAACSENNDITDGGSTMPKDSLSVFSDAEWKPGGELGTTTNEQGCYSNPAPIVEQRGLTLAFKGGENFFEHDANLFTKPFWGLGPAWVRSGCEYCHPKYGHGKRQNEYRANQMGNGYLLVIYHPTAGTDLAGNAYAANSYITEVTGMPQTKAMYPFKAPIDETQIQMTWKKATDEHGNKFPDGETYDLEYPEVNIPVQAFNTYPKPDNYEVRLESTIGMYGTGLLDAISQDSMKAQYQRAAAHVELNPGMWDAATNDWASSAWYKLADGERRIKKFTYAMTRTSLQDGPGANAIWNITNVTRSDRHYLYTTKAWAKAQSMDPEVIEYIKKHGNNIGSLLYPYYGDGTDEGIAANVEKLLGLNRPTDAAEYEANFLNKAPWNGQEEMTNEDFYDFMVWHRGLGVPAARNLDSEEVQRGKKLFYQMGCTACHRPSWTIKEDNIWIDPASRAAGKTKKTDFPTYDNTVIWPYTDLVQHRLHMENDIRTGWCRTTPLWGRGLSIQETGEGSRLHDNRARNVVEAIMWHGYSPKSDAYRAAQKFYNLSKSDRDAVVAFVNAI